MNPSIGALEGFFGPTWSWENRASYSTFLQRYPGSFYIYAPKADPYLRKRWKENHPTETWANLVELRSKFKLSNVNFGVGLSPFEIHGEFSLENKKRLKDKVQALNELQPDILGLFFDDMKPAENLASIQSEVCNWVCEHTKAKVLFCPSYYSLDRILDKVFGQRPEGYLTELGQSLPKEVEIMWTGEKVISPEITSNHVLEVTETLRRKPFIWENYFANDGPKQCHFLKLKPVTGRDHSLLTHCSGFAINPMNQAGLSQISIDTFYNTLCNTPTGKKDPLTALKDSVGRLCSPQLSEALLENQKFFTEVGTSDLVKSQKEEMLSVFDTFDEPIAQEVTSWLRGDFLVDSECLTD